MADRPLTPRPPWEGRRVVLGVTGGIAAYKAVQVARDLTRLGARVDTVLTESVRAFVAPLSFEGVTGREAHTELLAGEGRALHIGLGQEADLILVAPATADFVARAAQGRSDDLLGTTLLVTRAPVLLAPAMNDRMYGHTQSQRNLEHCRDVLGYRLAGPGVGPLAAGEGAGPGRMLEPEALVDHAGRILGADSRLEDRRILVTAGPTWEPLDPVRYLGNRSSGRMGFALAREAWLRGGDVVLVAGPSELPDPVGVRTVRIRTAREMFREVEAHIPEADVTIFAAAVSDFRPREVRSQKTKKGPGVSGPGPIELIENPDIALETVGLKRDGAVVVGFALETEKLRERALEKLRDKDFDFIVANDPGEEGAGFEVETNRVLILDRQGEEERLPLLRKDIVAGAILDRAASRLSQVDVRSGS